jgi:putative heme-binding domain-containing protein
MANNNATRNLRLGIACCLLSSLFYFLPLTGAQHAPPAQRDLATRIETGRRVFLASCSMSYCHGASGAGGGGPKLKDRKFSAKYVAMVTHDGIPGSAMPAFKNSLSKEQIADVTAYTLSLGPENAKQLDELRANPTQLEALVNPTANAATKPAAPPSSASTPIEAATTRGNVAAGRELFFAAEIVQNCRVCHTFQGKGGKVGPDLTGISSKSVEEIKRSIVTPHAAVDEKFATFAVTLRDGRRFVGVKRDETDDTLRLYDTSSLPPVSRAFLKTEIAKTEKLTESAMPGHYGQRFTPQQLDDLVAFLKSTGGS